MKHRRTLLVLVGAAVALSVLLVLLSRTDTDSPSTPITAPPVETLEPEDTDIPAPAPPDVPPPPSPTVPPSPPENDRVPQPDASDLTVSLKNETAAAPSHTQLRVNAQIALLQQESIDDSLANLYDLEFFKWPGSTLDQGGYGITPLLPSAASYEPHLLMANRRVLKIVQQLSALDKDAAADIVSRELTDSLPQYDALFAAYIDKVADILAPSARPDGIGFRASNNPDGSPTLRGSRWKILSLAFVASRLNLTAARPALMDVCACALEQRQEFYDSTRYNDLRVSILQSASLYNRQVLAMVLVGTSSSPQTLEKILQDGGAVFDEIDLTSWDAAATRYDLHTRLLGVPVDYSKGRFPVRYLREISDETFDALLEAARRE